MTDTYLKIDDVSSYRLMKLLDNGDGTCSPYVVADLSVAKQPNGLLGVASQPTLMFQELFNTSLDTTVVWTAQQTGTGAGQAVASGAITLGSGTSNSGNAAIFSKATFPPYGTTFNIENFIFKLNTNAIALTDRYLGVGTIPASPTTAVPVTDGYFIHISATGAVFGEIWQAGTKIGTTADIAATLQTAGNFNYASIEYKNNVAIFTLGGGTTATTTTVTLTATGVPASQTLPISLLCINGAAGTTNAQLIVNQLSLADEAKTGNFLQDGVNAQFRQTVKNASTAVVATDFAAVVGIHPSSNTVVPTAAVAGGYTPGKLVSAATTNPTSVKASAGKLGYAIASNIATTVAYLKFYNKASAPTVGTDVPVQVIAIPANIAGAGVVFCPNIGINFSIGIAFAITGLAADSDTTAVALNNVTISYGTI